MKFSCLLVTFVLLLINQFSFSQCDSNTINSDYVISSNTTMGGAYVVNGSFKINAGVTVNVEPMSAGGCGALRIYADNITIYGNINADGAGYEGGTAGTGGTAVSSSTGDEAGLTGCSNTGSAGQIEVEGGYPGTDGLGLGNGRGGKDGNSGSGSKQHCGFFSDHFGLIGGSSGASAGGGGAYGGDGSDGGSGGNGVATYTFDNLTLSTSYAINAGNGKSGGNGGSLNGTSIGMDIDFGSGGGGAGGGGRSYGIGSQGSSGGAGGGMIKLVAEDSLLVSGLLSTQGDNGGSGGAGGDGGAGGSDNCCTDGNSGCEENTYSCGSGGGSGAGGGSGGGIFLKSNKIALITGSLISTGGDGGLGGNGGVGGSCDIGGDNVYADAGDGGELGGAGGGGRIKIFTTDCPDNSVSASTSYGGGTGFGGTADNGSYNVDQSISCPVIDTTDTSGGGDPTSLTEYYTNKSISFTIFPNPAKSELSITFDKKYYNGSIATIQIFDQMGRSVLITKTIINEKPELIQLTDITNGLYTLRVVIDDNHGFSNFLIVE
jgi:hypothetical protein